MRTGRIFRGAPLLAGAAVGVFIGHTVAYLVAFPAAAQRASEMADAGHAYWPNAIWLLFQFVAFAVATVAIRSLRERAAVEPGRPERPLALFLWLYPRLASLQVAGFVVMEIAERVAVGEPLHSLWTGHLVLIGVASQLAVAVMVAFAMIVVARVAEGIASASRSPLVHARARIPRSVPLVVASRAARPPGAWGLRGPPEDLFA